MSLPQQKFRELVFQILYSQDAAHSEEDALTEMLMKQLQVTKRSVRMAQERVRDLQTKLAEIDPLIAKASLSYAFDRIQTVEKNVLRLGVYELLYDKEVPAKVAIAEAIRLSRKFGSPESSAFVNAVLDSLYKADQGQEIDNSALEASADALARSEEISAQAALEQKDVSDDDSVEDSI